ncbi:MAG: hypothetical protein IJN34_08510 [Clostridia bacterium]|nr:hypothetical protein [Clostridia bacterium]
MKTVLMQGDSITNGLRNMDVPEDLGQWYAKRVAGALELAHPGEYAFINRGISGNRIVDIYARIKQDIINLKPDIMSLMIGTNDVWAEHSRKNGVPPEKYERFYEMILDEVEAALPDIKIILMGSYFQEGVQEYNDSFLSEVKERAEIVRRIAERRGYPYIATQPLFDEAEKSGVKHLTFDGVHPDYAGCELLKNALVQEIEKL